MCSRATRSSAPVLASGWGVPDFERGGDRRAGTACWPLLGPPFGALLVFTGPCALCFTRRKSALPLLTWGHRDVSGIE